MTSDARLLLSERCEIHFNGWISDSVRLQQAGWDLAIDFDNRRQCYWLMIRNRDLELRGVSDQFRMNILGGIHHHTRLQQAMNEHTTICINQVAQSPRMDHIHIQRSQVGHVMHMTRESNGFKPIDAISSVESVNMIDIMENGVFRLQQEEATLVQQADMEVVDMLEAIVAKQQPKQRELREERRHQQARNNYNDKDKPVGLILVA